MKRIFVRSNGEYFGDDDDNIHEKYWLEFNTVDGRSTFKWFNGGESSSSFNVCDAENKGWKELTDFTEHDLRVGLCSVANAFNAGTNDPQTLFTLSDRLADLAMDLKRHIERKEKWKPPYYVGQIFHSPSGKAMLSQIGEQKVTLISLSTGNRWTEGVNVGNVCKITQQELEQIFGCPGEDYLDQFSLCKENEVHTIVTDSKDYGGVGRICVNKVN